MNTTTLDKIANIYNGNSINVDYKKKHFTGLETGYPFIATKDVSFNGVVNYDNGVKIPFETEYKTAEPGSVFICAEGGSAGRKIAYITEKVCFGNKLFCLQPKDGKYNGRYLYYYLMSDTFQTQFKLMLTGLIGGVSAKKFKSFTIPVLPIEEQERIVTLLDDQFAKIDTLKANADQQLKAAKDLFQSALKQLLTPKEGWEESIITSIVRNDCSLSYGIVQPGDGVDCGVPVVRPVDITNRIYVGKDGLKKTTEQISNAYKRTILTGDEILLCVRGTTGLVAIASRELEGCNVTRGIVPIRLINRINKKFIYYTFLTPAVQNEFARITTGSTLKQINIKDLRELTIPLPSLREQERIAARLDAISEKVKALQANYDKTINLCNDLKQALLKSIFE